jgi:hypothetical protein
MLLEIDIPIFKIPVDRRLLQHQSIHNRLWMIPLKTDSITFKNWAPAEVILTRSPIVAAAATTWFFESGFWSIRVSKIKGMAKGQRSKYTKRFSFWTVAEFIERRALLLGQHLDNEGLFGPRTRCSAWEMTIGALRSAALAWNGPIGFNRPVDADRIAASSRDEQTDRPAVRILTPDRHAGLGSDLPHQLTANETRTDLSAAALVILSGTTAAPSSLAAAFDSTISWLSVSFAIFSSFACDSMGCHQRHPAKAPGPAG